MDVFEFEKKIKTIENKELDIISANIEAINKKKAYLNILRQLKKSLKNANLETDSRIGRANNRELIETIQEIDCAESYIQNCKSQIVQYLEPVLLDLKSKQK